MQQYSVGGEPATLIVDDDTGILDIIQEVLEWKGIRVLTAKSVEEAKAVERAYPGPISLMILDLVMKDGNGPVVAQYMRERRPGIRVIFMSGTPPEHVLCADDFLVGDTFLAKPFTLKAILEHVEEK